MRPSHYWRKDLSTERRELFAAAFCDAQGTVDMLKNKPESELSWFDRFIAWFTTPFKKIGIEGWKETGCVAKSTGTPVRDAQHSSDGFWTIDMAISTFTISGVSSSGDRFIRIEVEPGTKAHDICDTQLITSSSNLELGGAVVIDKDGPFLEIHPDEDFSVQA